MPGLVARWRSLPGWARWLSAFVVVAAFCAGFGMLVGLGWDDGLFFGGAVLVLLSITQVRLGGARETVVARTRDGMPVKDRMPRPEREAEIRRGVGLFLMGLALWGIIGVAAAARFVL